MRPPAESVSRYSEAAAAAHVVFPAFRPDRPTSLVPFPRSRYNVAVHPLVIGVAGGSGSGKTTVVRKIVEALDDTRVTVLEHDRYYRDRGYEIRTHDLGKSARA